MAGEAIVLDPTSEDATNTELVLSEANGYYLLEHAYPDPQEETLWASSIDTEGARRAGGSLQNREIPVKLDLLASTDAAFTTAQRNLDKKIGKLRREGGTYKRTLPNGDVIVFDVMTVTGGERLFDVRFAFARSTTDTLTFVCQPYGRGTAQTFSATSETSLPVLRITAASVKGDVDGLGKLVVDELQAVDQFWLHWGLRSRYYSSSANNALFYEAEGRTAQGGAATAVGTSPASGPGSNVMRQGTLTPGWQSMLSTQATGGGSHLEHIGVYEFWARVFMPTSNTGAVSIRLDWAEGDFRRVTSNVAVTFAANHVREGKWVLVNLGQVFLSKVAQGTQRWEGRIVAGSTVAGDDLDVDCFWLRPLSEGNGTARELVLFDTPTVFSARDEFDQAAGVLAGKTAPVGGTWAGAGDADDFSVNTATATARRTAVSDVDFTTGRYEIVGATNYTAVAAQIDNTVSPSTGVSGVHLQGALIRYTDVNNWLMGVLHYDVVTKVGNWKVYKRVAGTVTELDSVREFQLAENYWRSIRLVADTAGRWVLWGFPTGSTPSRPMLKGDDAALATGGALATGKPGFYDAWTDSVACTRDYDNFQVFVPAADAAVFASQSLELRHDRVIREDSGGTIWTPVSDYAGDYLRIPAAGLEGRTTEILVKGSRNDPDGGSDVAIDDIRGTLTVIPRYLKVPDAAPVFSPSDLAGLELWLKPESLGADTTAISSWADSSGLGNNATQGTGANQPVVAAGVLDGFKVARFDGSDDFLVASALLANDASRTVFVVGKQATGTSGRSVCGFENHARISNNGGTAWGYNSDNASVVVNLGGTPTNWTAVTMRYTSAAVADGYVNGGLPTNFDPNDQFQGSPTFPLVVGARCASAAGATALNFWNGDVAEVIVFNSTLSDADKNKVLGYLSRKYPTLGSFGT